MLVVSIFVSFNKNQRTESERDSVWYIVFSSIYNSLGVINETRTKINHLYHCSGFFSLVLKPIYRT